MDPAPTLPVAHLSKSSIRLYQQCPEKWRRRYIEHEREPLGVPLVLGKTVGAAVGANLQQKIETREDWPADEVVEYFAGEFEETAEVEDVDWGRSRPGRVKDQGAQLVRVYQQVAAPHVQPVSVERRVEFRLAGAEWTVQGYIDYELEDGTLADLKVKAKAPTEQELATELDPTLYLAARRAEGNPARAFYYDVVKKTQEPMVSRYRAERSDRQLDRFLQRLAQISQEIAWRTESGNWSGAPAGAWYCSPSRCGFWQSCPYGGG